MSASAAKLADGWVTNHFQRSSNSVDRTILVSSGSEALAAAQWLLARYKEPSPRIPPV